MTNTEQQHDTQHESEEQKRADQEHIDQADEAKARRCQSKQAALEEAARRKIEEALQAACEGPAVTYEVLFDEERIDARETEDAWYERSFGSADAFLDHVADRLEARAQLPRVGEMLHTEEGELYFISELWHNFDAEGEGRADVTVLIGWGKPDDRMEPARAPRTPQNVEVVFDKDRTRPPALRDEFHQPEYAGVDAFLGHLARKLSERAALPRIGESVSDGREVFYVVDVDHNVERPTDPEDDPFTPADATTIWLGSEMKRPGSERTPEPAAGGSSPDEPAPQASNRAEKRLSEKRIPARVKTYRGEESTISVVENMRTDLGTLHAMAQSVWKTLKEADELRDWECVYLMDHMVAELEHQRDRIDAIVKGYYGRKDA